MPEMSTPTQSTPPASSRPLPPVDAADFTNLNVSAGETDGALTFDVTADGKIRFGVGCQYFTLDYEPEDDQSYQFMKRMITQAFVEFSLRHQTMLKHRQKEKAHG